MRELKVTEEKYTKENCAKEQSGCSEKRIQKMTHGGDRYRNHVELDFSVNINPLGMPDSVRKALLEAIEESVYYPDLHYEKLREGIAERFQVRTDQVVCGNGASELLMAAVHAFQPKKVLLPVPSFLGYQWALNAEDIRVTTCSFPEASCIDLTDYDMVFLTNPNNPTGRYLEPEDLVRICERCEEAETIVILDECFMELSDEPEAHTMTGKIHEFQNLLILRAFTKSFAIPGVRLGYLMGSDTRKISEIERHLPEWNLSVMAQKAGVAALRVDGFLEKSRQYIAGERTFLKEELLKLGFDVDPSVTNFMLIHPPSAGYKDPKEEASMLCQKLLERGILIRSCGDYEGLPEGTCRIAVRNHEENLKFIQEIGRIYDR